MEQDINEYIKVLETIVNYRKFDGIYSTNEVIFKAIEHLIKAYKELEEERQIVGMPVKNKRDGRIGVVLHQWESGSIAVLESINPRVINTHDSWNTLEIVTDEVKQTQTKCESIPVSLVEEKIEELQRQFDFYAGREHAEWQDGEFDGEQCDDISLQIRILKELLEKRK